MSAIRLGLLLIIVLGLAGFTLQNMTPQFSVVFLGWRSPTFPLGYLILGGLGSGIVTGLLLLTLLRLNRHLVWRQLQTRQSVDFEPEFDAEPDVDQWQNEPQSSSVPQDTPPKPPPAAKSPPVDQANYLREDWSYEAEQKPKSGSQAGSSYSYSYRDSQRSGVGRRESVYDADYRVIVPPQTGSEDDDYGFDDEEEDGDQSSGHR